MKPSRARYRPGHAFRRRMERLQDAWWLRMCVKRNQPLVLGEEPSFLTGEFVRQHEQNVIELFARAVKR